MRNLAVNTQTLVETTINNNEVNNNLDIVNHFPGVGQQIGPSIVDQYGFLHGRNFENAFNRVHQENGLFLDVRNVDLFQLNNNNNLNFETFQNDLQTHVQNFTNSEEMHEYIDAMGHQLIDALKANVLELDDINNSVPLSNHLRLMIRNLQMNNVDTQRVFVLLRNQIINDRNNNYLNYNSQIGDQNLELFFNLFDLQTLVNLENFLHAHKAFGVCIILFIFGPLLKKILKKSTWSYMTGTSFINLYNLIRRTLVHFKHKLQILNARIEHIAVEQDVIRINNINNMRNIALGNNFTTTINNMMKWNFTTWLKIFSRGVQYISIGFSFLGCLMYICTYSTDPTIARIANEFFSIFSGNRGLLALTNTPGTALLIERGLKAKTFCSRCFS